METLRQDVQDHLVHRLIKTGKNNVNRALFYIGGEFKVSPVDGSRFKHTMFYCSAELVGIYNKAAPPEYIIEDINFVLNGG